jgi:hypothetical protein
MRWTYAAYVNLGPFVFGTFQHPERGSRAVMDDYYSPPARGAGNRVRWLAWLVAYFVIAFVLGILLGHWLHHRGSR